MRASRKSYLDHLCHVEGLNFTTEIHVVATSLTKADLTNLETLDGDAYRLSYWYAVLKALGVTCRILVAFEAGGTLHEGDLCVLPQPGRNREVEVAA